MYGYGFRAINQKIFSSGGGAINPLWSGLLAYYRADNSVTDETGNGHDLTLVNGATYDTGIIGQGFSLDGVNDYISLPDDSFRPTGNFSISMWINLSNSNNKYLFMSGSLSPINCILIYTNASRMRFYIGSSGLSFKFDTTVNITLNTYEHYVFTFNNASKLASIYINGILNIQTTSTHAPSFPSPSVVNIGASTTPNNYTIGNLDEIGLWDGKELTASEITELYNSGLGLQY